MKASAQELNAIANTIQQQLLEAGFVIHRYDSYTSNSIYLKLDFGLGNSIRISDHRGKQHLHYRYNVHTNLKEDYQDTSGKYPKFYFSQKQIQKLINQIINTRESKLARNGREWYQQMLQSYAKSSLEQPGFWAKARQLPPVRRAQ